MRYASRFRNPTRVWCVKILAFALAIVPVAVLMTNEDAAAQTLVNLSIDPVSVDEDGGPQVVSVRATIQDTSIVRTLPINIALRPVSDQSTATIPDDLVATPLDQPIVIAPDQTESVLEVTVVPTDDEIYEGTETLVVVGVETPSGDPLTMPVSLAINDDEPMPAFSLSATPDMIDEGGGPQVVTVKATATVASSVPTVIALAPVFDQSTATFPDDLVATPLDQPIVIAAGETEGVLEVTVVPTDDNIYEGTETVVIVGVGAMGAPLTMPISVAINDNESMPAFTLSATPVTVDEGGGPQVVTVKATATVASTLPTVIVLAPVFDQSTATFPDDLVASPLDRPIIIAAGETEGVLEVTVTPVDDNVYEGTETLVVVGLGVTGDPLTMPLTVEIIDNEPVPTFTLSAAPAMVDEGGGPQVVTVTATATVASTVPTVIALAPVFDQSTATFPDDLVATPLDQPIVIAPGETEGVLEVTVVPTDDGIYEGTETFVIVGVGAMGEPLTMPLTVEITDNEPAPVITLSATPDMLDEGGGPQVGVVTATTSEISSQDLHVGLVPLLDQSTATLIGPGADLAVLELAADPNIVITIPAGQTTGSINLTVVPVDDDAYESDEFAVFAGNLLGTISEPVVITIVDNDTPNMNLSAVPTSLREDGGAQTVTFDVTMTGSPVPVPTVITLVMTGTAAQEIDYTWGGTAEIAIPAGGTTAGTQLTFQVEDDEVHEPGNETIVVTARWQHQDLGHVTLTIIDNFPAPAVANPIPEVSLIAGGAFRTDLSETFSGKDLTFSAQASGGAISVELTGASLVVTGNYLGSGRVTVAATNAAGSVSYNFGVSVTAAFSLNVDQDTLREDGGTQSVSFTVALSGAALSVPTAITLDLAGTATQGTDYQVNGTTEIVIAAGQSSATTQLDFSVVDDAVYEPNDETIVVSANWQGSEIDRVTLAIVDNFPAPAVTSAIADMTLEAGDSRQADVAGSFSGKGLAFSASSSDDAVSAEVSGSTLTVTADHKGSARVTVLATNDAGSVSLDFGVTVTTVTQERMIYTDILAAMGRGILSSVSSTIGGRFAVSGSERQLALGNRRIDGMAAGMEALVGLSGTRETRKYGAAGGTSAGETMARHSGQPDPAGEQPISARELMRGTSFYYALDDAPQVGSGRDGLRYTVWGAGDWNAFEGAAAQTATYDGSLISGYFGMDVSKAGSWTGGVAFGRTMGSSDYTGSVADGKLETTLNGVYPYVLWQVPSYIVEVWGIGGFGSGKVESNEMTNDLSMRMFLFGARAQLVGSGIEGLDLGVIGDAGITNLTAADSEHASLSDLEAGVHRVRVGLEGSGTIEMDSGMHVSPLVQVTGRYDGGDGQTGGGIEVAGGLKIARGRIGVEARGRLLASHSGEGVKERGISLAAYVNPMAAGRRGLSMTVVPRIGAATDMSGDMWRDEQMEGLTRPSREGVGVKAEIGYGLARFASSDILMTPFGAMDVAGDDRRRVRLGARFGSVGAGDAGGAASGVGALSFELAGERIEGYGRTPDHRIGLIGRMSF